MGHSVTATPKLQIPCPVIPRRLSGQVWQRWVSNGSGRVITPTADICDSRSGDGRSATSGNSLKSWCGRCAITFEVCAICAKRKLDNLIATIGMKNLPVSSGVVCGRCYRVTAIMGRFNNRPLRICSSTKGFEIPPRGSCRKPSPSRCASI